MSRSGVRKLVSIACLLVACDAGRKPAPPEPPAPPAKPPWVVAVKPDLAYLPADADMVVRIDVTELRRSKLWPTYEHDVSRRLVPGFAGCDYDPLSEASSVTIGVVVKTELDVFVIRGVDRDKARRCLQASRTVQLDGELATVTKANGSTYVLGFADAATMVMQGPKQPSRATLAQALQRGAPLQQDAGLARVTSQLPQAAVTIVSRPGSVEIQSGFGALGGHLQYFYGSLNLNAVLEIKYAMVLTSADEASQFANMMKGQVGSPQVKQLFDQLEVHAQGTTAAVSVVLGEAKLASLWGMIRGMIGSE